MRKNYLIAILIMVMTLLSGCGLQENQAQNNLSSNAKEIESNITIENSLDNFFKGISTQNYEIFKKAFHEDFITLCGGEYEFKNMFFELIDETDFSHEAIYKVVKTIDVSLEEQNQLKEVFGCFGKKINDIKQVYIETNTRDLDDYFFMIKIDDSWYMLSGD